MEDSDLAESSIAKEGERVIARIMESREMAQIGSRGGIAVRESSDFEGIMKRMLEDLLSAGGEEKR
jgi:hypothetical protein